MKTAERNQHNLRLTSRSALVVAASLLLGGCTFAKYSSVRVQVVDGQTQAGIPKAQVRTYYIKPMWDMTYQRKDRERTDSQGFATLRVATNWSQRAIVGWTHGILPMVSVYAGGYQPRDVGVAVGRTDPVLIQMTKTNAP